MKEKWAGFAISLYLIAGVFIYLGANRIEGYFMSDSEYSSETDKFAFVGNDADNLIINSNIFGAYFSLAAAFVIAGTLALVTGALLVAINGKKEIKQIPAIDKDEVIENV